MANEEQLAILKQGVEDWNEWREIYADIKIDLSRADLSHVHLSQVNLGKANLESTNLLNTFLSDADLSQANFKNANLKSAGLSDADLSGANLTGTDLTNAFIWGSNLDQARLNGTILNSAHLGNTRFLRVDLNGAIGLEKVNHEFSSIIDIGTLEKSRGKIPDAFLRGCGLSDWEIESAKLYNPDLTNDEIAKIQYRIYDLRATQAIQVFPLFISYSHQDKPFVDKMDTALTKKGVRFWRDIHDATAGRLETQIDRAIRRNPTVLLVLSKNSIKSDWVEHEVRTARELEKELGRDALCPIALDDSWNSSPWPKRVMEQVKEYNILDFSKWENDSVFEEQFVKLLNGLDLFYKKPKV